MPRGRRGVTRPPAGPATARQVGRPRAAPSRRPAASPAVRRPLRAEPLAPAERPLRSGRRRCRRGRSRCGPLPAVERHRRSGDPAHRRPPALPRCRFPRRTGPLPQRAPCPAAQPGAWRGRGPAGRSRRGRWRRGGRVGGTEGVACAGEGSPPGPARPVPALRPDAAPAVPGARQRRVGCGTTGWTLRRGEVSMGPTTTVVQSPVQRVQGNVFRSAPRQTPSPAGMTGPVVAPRFAVGAIPGACPTD